MPWIGARDGRLGPASIPVPTVRTRFVSGLECALPLAQERLLLPMGNP